MPRLFDWLVALFPRDFRDRFGAEMRTVFASQWQNARASGRLAALMLLARTAMRMLAAASQERRAGRRDHRRRGALLDDLRWDLHLALRGLRRQPWFAAGVVAAVAIGVGAVATIFSAVNAIVLRPLPGVRDGYQLVGIERRSPDLREGASASFLLFDHVRDRAASMDDVAAWSRVALSIATDTGDGAAVAGAIVSSNYFNVLGVGAIRGRMLVADEDSHPPAEPEVVLSSDFWRTRLGARDDVVGSTVRVNGRRYRVAGVAADGFRGVFTPLKIDAWVPLSAQPHVRPGRDLANAPWLWVFGRLRNGTAAGQARSELTQIFTEWSRTSAEPAAIRAYDTARLTPLTGLPDDARQALIGYSAVLMGAAALVLLIAATNASSLLAARAMARARELSVRTALGARRRRLVRMLLTETLLLFALGGLGGVALASAGTAALERLPLPGDAAFSLELSPDYRVLIFSLAIALAAAVIAGVAPALRGTHAPPSSVLRDGATGSTRRALTGRILIAGQLACAIVLLAAAALFLRALSRGAEVDPGFDAAGVLVTRLNTEAYGYDDEASARFFASLTRALADAPGVAAAAFTNSLPLTDTPANGTIAVTTDDRQSRREWRIQTATVSDGYFESLRLPIIRGRSFVASDAKAQPDVVVISAALAERAWPGVDALGRTLEIGTQRLTVAGIAANAKQLRLDEPPALFVYTPIAARRQSSLTLVARMRDGSAASATTVAEIIRRIDPSIPKPHVTPLTAEIAGALLPQRVAAIVTGALGAGGLLLAAIGLYGSLAYSVTQRRRELGVRRALGATAGDVVLMVARQGLFTAAAGIVAGLAGAMLVTRMLSAYLLGVSPTDALALASASGIFIVVALAATLVPARRAARSDAATALRPD